MQTHTRIYIYINIYINIYIYIYKYIILYIHRIKYIYIYIYVLNFDHYVACVLDVFMHRTSNFSLQAPPWISPSRAWPWSGRTTETPSMGQPIRVARKPQRFFLRYAPGHGMVSWPTVTGEGDGDCWGHDWQSSPKNQGLGKCPNHHPTIGSIISKR